MDEKRKGEIALLWLKWKMRSEPIQLGKNLRRELGNKAKELGIELDEVMEFAEVMVRELVDEMFAKKDKAVTDDSPDSDINTQLQKKLQDRKGK